MPAIPADTPDHDAKEGSLDGKRIDRRELKREGIVDLGVSRAHGPVRGADTFAAGSNIVMEVGDRDQGAIESPRTILDVGIANYWASIHTNAPTTNIAHQRQSRARWRASGRRLARCGETSA
jgi:hypothetical protein